MCCRLLLGSMISVVFLGNAWLYGQVVQLPAQRHFSYAGSTWVPDQGQTQLAGNSYQALGTSQGGPGWSIPARGATTIGTQLSASVQVIDLDALDQAILNSATPLKRNSRQPTRMAAVSDQAATEEARQFLSGYPLASQAVRYGGPSYRDFKSSLGAATPAESIDPSLAESNVRHYLKLAQEAETNNRIQSARIYYRMAIESMTPELVQRYQRLLDEKRQTELEQQSTVNRTRF